MVWIFMLLGFMGTDAVQETSRLNEIYSWKTVDYVFPTASLREQLISSGKFKPQATIPMGLEVWGNKLFVTTPRRKEGVPVVLGYVNLQERDISPLVTPYPDYETNSLDLGENPDQVHITTAYRIQVDVCDRLWIIDSGQADVGEGLTMITRPKILVYNLANNRLILNYELKAADYKSDSLFATIAVDVTNTTCEDAFAYIPDCVSYALIVFSLRDRDSWRVRHNFFHIDPLAGDFNFSGINLQMDDGVVSVTLSNIKSDGYRLLYFHSLVSYNEFSVSTKILRNKTIASRSYHEFTYLGRRGDNTQSSVALFDEQTAVMFFLEIHNHALTCWNTFARQDMPGNIQVVAQDTENKEFAFLSDLKIDRNQSMWLLTNNLPLYRTSELDPDVYNHFVFRTPVIDAIQGTKCDPFVLFQEDMFKRMLNLTRNTP